MMNNENLKPVNVENNQESLLLGKIRELEEENKELKGKNRKLEENVAELNVDLMHDPLTELYTRRYLTEIIKETISSLESPERERRAEGYSTFSLLFCDLDKFKEVNDTYGHDGGDEVLKKVSAIIRKSVRTMDIVCRWGGDEIAVGLMGADEEEAAKIAEKIRTAVEEEVKDTGVTVSVGAVSYEKGLNMESVTDRADKAMYWAKENGKNKVVKYSDFLEAEKAKGQEEEKK